MDRYSGLDRDELKDWQMDRQIDRSINIGTDSQSALNRQTDE
jgi:hypothetical protein